MIYKTPNLVDYRESSVEDLTAIPKFAPHRRLNCAPFFSLPLRRKTVAESDSARLTCAVQGYPSPKVSWTKNGNPIYDGYYYNITNRWGVCMLEMRNVKLSDTGTYRCTATSVEGQDSSACELVVEERMEPDETFDYIRPSFHKPVRGKRVREGNTARLEIQVSGFPEPQIVWYKDNVRIDESEHISIEKFPGGAQALVITGVTATDAGRYKAAASSPAGKASCAADLEILEVEADIESEEEGELGLGRGRRRTRRKPKAKPQEPKPPRKPHKIRPLAETFEERKARRIQQRLEEPHPHRPASVPVRTRRRSYSPSHMPAFGPPPLYSPSTDLRQRRPVAGYKPIPYSRTPTPVRAQSVPVPTFKRMVSYAPEGEGYGPTYIPHYEIPKKGVSETHQCPTPSYVPHHALPVRPLTATPSHDDRYFSAVFEDYLSASEYEFQMRDRTPSFPRSRTPSSSRARSTTPTRRRRTSSSDYERMRTPDYETYMRHVKKHPMAFRPSSVPVRQLPESFTPVFDEEERIRPVPKKPPTRAKSVPPKQGPPVKRQIGKYHLTSLKEFIGSRPHPFMPREKSKSGAPPSSRTSSTSEYDDRRPRYDSQSSYRGRSTTPTSRHGMRSTTPASDYGDREYRRPSLERFGVRSTTPASDYGDREYRRSSLERQTPQSLRQRSKSPKVALISERGSMQSPLRKGSYDATHRQRTTPTLPDSEHKPRDFRLLSTDSVESFGSSHRRSVTPVGSHAERRAREIKIIDRMTSFDSTRSLSPPFDRKSRDFQRSTSRKSTTSPAPSSGQRRGSTPTHHELRRRDYRLSSSERESLESHRVRPMSPHHRRSPTPTSVAAERPPRDQRLLSTDSIESHGLRPTSPLLGRPVTPVGSDSLRTPREIRIIDRLSSYDSGRSLSPMPATRRSVTPTYDRQRRDKDRSASPVKSVSRDYHVSSRSERESFETQRHRTASPKLTSLTRRSVTPTSEAEHKARDARLLSVDSVESHGARPTSPLGGRPVTPVGTDSLRTPREVRIIDRLTSYDSSRERSVSPILGTRRDVTSVRDYHHREAKAPIAPKLYTPSEEPRRSVTPTSEKDREISHREASYSSLSTERTSHETLKPRSVSPLPERPVTPVGSDSLRTQREIRIIERMSTKDRTVSPPSASHSRYSYSDRGQRDYGLSSKRSGSSVYSRPEYKDRYSSSYSSSSRYDRYDPHRSYRQRSTSPTSRRSESPIYSRSKPDAGRDSYESSRISRQRSPSPKVTTTDYDLEYTSTSKRYESSRYSPTADRYDRSFDSEYSTSRHKSSKLGAFAPVGVGKPGSIPRSELPFKLESDLLEESGSDHSSPARFSPQVVVGGKKAVDLEKEDKTEDKLPEAVALTKEEAQREEKEIDIKEVADEIDEDSERLMARKKEAMIETDQKIDDTEGEGPPEFVRSMKDMTVNDGARVVLEVQITGARPMDVGWLRNGQDIPDSDEFRYVSRGNLHQLVIAEIFPEDSGKYTCEALNDHGEADCHCTLNVIEEPSVSISINVSQDVTATTTDHQGILDDENIPPEFFEEPQSQTVEEGGMACFVCDVDGEPVPTVTWSKDDVPIRDGGRFRVYSDKFSHTFEIPVALATDEGEYVCTATNKEGQTECGFSLRVIRDQTSTAAEKKTTDEPVQQADPPMMISSEPAAMIAPVAQSAPVPDQASEEVAKLEDSTEPEPLRFLSDSEAPVFIETLTDKVVDEEQGTTFQCRVTGKPLPEITWYFEDRPVQSSKFFQMSEEDDLCLLIIAEAYTDDAGKYSCHANNDAGEAVTSAMLVVNEPAPPVEPTPAAPATPPQTAPSFDKKIQDCEVQANSEAKFECTVTGTPNPDIKWFKNGKPLKDGIHHKISHGADGSCTLVLPRAQTEDSGEYKCQAENTSGSVSCVAKLNVKSAKKLPFMNKFQQDSSSGGKGPVKKGPAGKGGSSIMARAQMFGK